MLGICLKHLGPQVDDHVHDLSGRSILLVERNVLGLCAARASGLKCQSDPRASLRVTAARTGIKRRCARWHTIARANTRLDDLQELEHAFLVGQVCRAGAHERGCHLLAAASILDRHNAA